MIIFQCRFTEEQYEKIQSIAKNKHMQYSEVLRMLVNEVDETQL